VLFDGVDGVDCDGTKDDVDAALINGSGQTLK